MNAPRLFFVSQLTTPDIIEDVDLAIREGFQGIEISLDWKQNCDFTSSQIETLAKKKRHEQIDYILHIGMGNIDYQELLSVCKQNDYWGPFTLEVIGKENILKCRDTFYSVWQSE
ncbi:uncharacterized protein Dvar_17630 [Desulfosarcina variabilis str. Montpellier]|uniref:hypothetical protein n=1 Tax=Desulfosarcina variabilis TaxID=2300 RepID=UPI003AFAE35E